LSRASGDRVLLEQVWVNLLSNALKFSGKRDRPVIEVGAISDEKEHTYFVRDNGAGFDPRYQSKLFGVFQRLHEAADFAGTGVGLALVSRIVNRHGGRVWADGKPGEGATFYFTLPKEQSSGDL
jgi:light-regulated signal transduction histidine kinase (bacteriophytochrome)